MFRPNNTDKQTTLFDTSFLMPAKMQEKLENSWAATFREEVYKRIPEGVFACLYSEVDSRPNAPINVMVGADILKGGLGWTDEEMADHLEFDLLTRHALGMDEVGKEGPTLRTIYNFRRRVREHAERSEENLYSQVFAQVTDGQLSKMGLKTGWQRMDSTQLLSHIARMNRLELVLTVLQQGVRGLSEEKRREWEEAQAAYLQKPAQNICYRLKNEAVEGHLVTVGGLLLKLKAQLSAEGAEAGLVERVERVIDDQYYLEETGGVRLCPAEGMRGDSLQSPHDPEATYRQKNGQSYKGYVVNLSETCDPANPVQLITSIQTATNVTDDGALLAEVLEDLAQRQVLIDQATVDGGYNGPVSEAACRQHQVSLRPTTIRGGQTAPDRFGWEEYHWTVDEQGQPSAVGCPGGQTVPVQQSGKVDWLLARFDAELCLACPFYQHQCRVKPRKRTSPTLNVKQRSIQVACLRQGMSAANSAIRANVESTIHAFKHPFAGGKLPVRGLIRSHMLACGSALMVNFRRLHGYLYADPADEQGFGQVSPAKIHFELVIASCRSIWHRFWGVLLARPTHSSGKLLPTTA